MITPKDLELKGTDISRINNSDKKDELYFYDLIYGIRLLFNDNVLPIEKEDLIDIMKLVQEEYKSCRDNGDLIGMQQREYFFNELKKSKALPYDREADERIATRLSHEIKDEHNEKLKSDAGFASEFYLFYELARKKYGDTSPKKTGYELVQFFTRKSEDLNKSNHPKRMIKDLFKKN